jgi:xanthine dehydrogenase accessory factor
VAASFTCSWSHSIGEQGGKQVSGELYRQLRSSLLADEPVVLATVTAVEGEARGRTPLAAKVVVWPDGRSLGSLGDSELDRITRRDAQAALERGVTVTRHYGPHGEARRDEVSVFFEVFAPSARLIVFGAVDFTRALVEVGKVLGFAVAVCDPRPVFATRARFPLADEIAVEWPDRYLERVRPELGPRDAVCVLTHDTKFDVPAILGALGTRVGYLGAMGSRRTHEKRWARLVESGADESELKERLMSPIGLDIGARTPEETAPVGPKAPSAPCAARPVRSTRADRPA